MGFGNASDSTNRMTHGGKAAHQPKQDGCGGLGRRSVSAGHVEHADCVGPRVAAVATSPETARLWQIITAIKTSSARLIIAASASSHL